MVMKHFLLRLLILLVLLINHTAGFAASAKSWAFTSPKTQTTLIELFTSEGCSSCPPAERWLSRWKNDARLWKKVIPLAFHVDYWDDLGWTDRLASPAYSSRQRLYASKGYANSVYTPGIFTNGREWRGWFTKPQLVLKPSPAVGTLRVTVGPNELSALFETARPMDHALLLNIAVVGFNIRSSIASGENRGKVLNHDFAVLNWRILRENSTHHWHTDHHGLDLSQPHARALAIWVSTPDDPTPLQATGGWLTPK
jgi:hypothetical protein